jgi:hypothetical protein
VTIGVRMIDREALRYARSTATILDFCVVLTVIVVAISVGLIMASAVGVGLSMILFVREQSGGSPVRFKLLLGETSSTWHRPEAEMAYLAARTDDGVVFGLQGALFFGNTYRLYSDLEQEIRTRRFVVIDLRRVPFHRRDGHPDLPADPRGPPRTRGHARALRSARALAPAPATRPTCWIALRRVKPATRRWWCRPTSTAPSPGSKAGSWPKCRVATRRRRR